MVGGYEVINNQYGKLSYLVTMLVETEGNNCKPKQDLYQTEGFKILNEVISNYCNCKGIWIDSKLEPSSWNENYLDHDGYIDHQSCEDYHSLLDFLNDYNITIEEFIFCNNVELIIDNDNH